jgi:hypothetical protein
MTTNRNLELLLRSHYEATADWTVADDQLGSILDDAAARRQRPAWLAALRSSSMTATTLARPAIPRAAWLLAGAALLATILVVGALLAGSKTVLAPPVNGQIVYATMDDALGDTVPYVANPDGTHARKLVPFTVEGPFWSPDGKRIGLGDGWINADGTGLHPWNLSLDFDLHCWDWSPDGQRMLCEGFAEGDAIRDASVHGIYSVRAEDGSDVIRLTAQGQQGVPAAYSPDGRQFLWGLDPDGNESCVLMVSNVDGSNPREISSQSFGCDPSWSPDGTTILAQHNGALYSVDVATGAETAVTIEDVPMATIYAAEWSPDGSRILLKRWMGGANNELYSMLPDGSDLLRITTNEQDDRFFDWGVHPLDG